MRGIANSHLLGEARLRKAPSAPVTFATAAEGVGMRAIRFCIDRSHGLLMRVAGMGV